MSLFGEKLQQQRKMRGMTQDQLAKKISVSKSYISTLERGYPHPNSGASPKPAREIVDKIAFALEWDVDLARVFAGYAPDLPFPVEFLEIVNDFTDEEISELVKYAKYLKSNRKSD